MDTQQVLINYNLNFVVILFQTLFINLFINIKIIFFDKNLFLKNKNYFIYFLINIIINKKNILIIIYMVEKENNIIVKDNNVKEKIFEEKNK